jgi:hypothetical protein
MSADESPCAEQCREPRCEAPHLDPSLGGILLDAEEEERGSQNADDGWGDGRPKDMDEGGGQVQLELLHERCPHGGDPLVELLAVAAHQALHARGQGQHQKEGDSRHHRPGESAQKLGSLLLGAKEIEEAEQRKGAQECRKERREQRYFLEESIQPLQQIPGRVGGGLTNLPLSQPFRVRGVEVHYLRERCSCPGDQARLLGVRCVGRGVHREQLRVRELHGQLIAQTPGNAKRPVPRAGALVGGSPELSPEVVAHFIFRMEVDSHDSLSHPPFRWREVLRGEWLLIYSQDAESCFHEVLGLVLDFLARDFFGGGMRRGQREVEADAQSGVMDIEFNVSREQGGRVGIEPLAPLCDPLGRREFRGQVRLVAGAETDRHGRQDAREQPDDEHESGHHGYFPQQELERYVGQHGVWMRWREEVGPAPGASSSSCGPSPIGVTRTACLKSSMCRPESAREGQMAGFERPSAHSQRGLGPLGCGGSGLNTTRPGALSHSQSYAVIWFVCRTSPSSEHAPHCARTSSSWASGPGTSSWSTRP